MGSEQIIKKIGFGWGIIIRAGMTLTILGYLGLKIRWKELGMQLMESDPVWLLTAFFFIGVAFFLGSIRWWLLLRIQGIFVPLKVAVALTFIGQFFNSFLLGTTGGDVIKTLYVLKYTSYKKAHATLSVIMDRILGLFVSLCCALATLSWQFRFLIDHEEPKMIIYGLLILFGCVLVGTVGLLLIPFQQLPIFFHQLWKKIPQRHIFESLIEGFRLHKQRLTLVALIYSFGASFLVFTAGYYIALAIHLQVSYLQILTILAIVVCIISLPISIGGHGVREGIFVTMFTAFEIIKLDKRTGAGQEPAILFSLLFFALFLGWSIVGGVIYLIFGHSKDKSVASEIIPLGGNIC